MAAAPFDPDFEALPAELPVFPLPGVLLLPRGRLPLNIFEPRYLAMTRAALAGPRLIGMIQPAEEERPGAPPPRLRPLGCAGRMVSFSETEDGRYLIVLKGLIRFAVAAELEMVDGYRRVVPDFAPFRADLEPDRGAIDRPRLLAALKAYFTAQGIGADWAAVESAEDERLVTSLAMICPFGAGEKQALLEAPDLAARGRMMVSLLEMAAFDSGPPSSLH
ncbi:MAG: LON peptidase substrate-binding domain-containing protein [Rhodospirillaceae bacterium]|nr:LON peptidase substrate-binding domain-containing protein [Rhodospirillaceae bacterium]